MKIHLSNFTPVLDDMVDKYGIVTAMVYGAMMRFAQISSGICWASQETIAKRAGISAKTVHRHESILEAAGLIELVKHEAGETIHYRVIDVMVVETAIVKDEGGWDRESEGVGQRVRGGRTESPTKIQLRNKEDNVENEEQFSTCEKPPDLQPQIIYEDCNEDGLTLPPQKKKREPQPEVFKIAEALAEVTGMSFAINSKQLYATARELMKDPRVSAEYIRMIYSPGQIWYQKDWRGKTGVKPKLYQIRETLFTFDIKASNVITGDVKSR